MLGVATNEEDMLLKDLKMQISTKKPPGLIINIKIISFLVAILLVVLMGKALIMRPNLNYF